MNTTITKVLAGLTVDETDSGAVIIFNPDQGHDVAVMSEANGLAFIRTNGVSDYDPRKVAQRIVACVNGCAGLKPAEVPELVKALEDISQLTEMHQISCDDPQCGDSTWDHYCNARSERQPTAAALIASAVLAKAKEVAV